jgi:hypothetical protein
VLIAAEATPVMTAIATMLNLSVETHDDSRRLNRTIIANFALRQGANARDDERESMLQRTPGPASRKKPAK